MVDGFVGVFIDIVWLLLLLIEDVLGGIVVVDFVLIFGIEFLDELCFWDVDIMGFG